MWDLIRRAFIGSMGCCRY